MGCDIHMVLEKHVQIPDTETTCWIGINAFPWMSGTVYSLRSDKGGPQQMTGHVSWEAINRNYTLFAELAGVRGDGPAPRGVPDDASVMTLVEVDGWGVDGHSHTWWTLDEALPIFIRSGQFGDPGKAVGEALKAGNTHAALMAFAHHFWSFDSEEDLSKYRLVIWFDN